MMQSNQHSSQAALARAAGESTPRPVVLVPGILDTARKMRFVEKALTRAGLQPYVLSPQPTNGTVGIDELARRLARQIDATFEPTVRFDFVGFSMGGLIGRYYLQQLGGTDRVGRFITVASPHRGSLTAQPLRALPALGQMTPDSDFIDQLNSDLMHLRQTDFRAIWTPFDLSVTPPHNAYLPGFPHYRVWSPFHATLLMDPSVIHLVLDLLQPERAAQPHLSAT